MKNKISRTSIFAVLGIFTAVSCVVFLGYRANKLKSSKQLPESVRRTVMEARAVWKNRSFSEVSSSDVVNKVSQEVERACVDSFGEGLSTDQVQKAKDSVYRFLSAYSAKDVATFMDFRLPAAGYSFSRERVEWVRRNLVRFSKMDEGSIPVDGLALFKMYWNEDRWGTKAYISRVSPSDIYIVFNRNSGEPAPDDFKQTFPKDTPIHGIQKYYPFFLYPDQPKGSGSADDDAIIITVGCIAEVRDPDGALPLLFKAYWSGKSSEWIPFGLAVGSLYQRKHAPAF